MVYVQFEIQTLYLRFLCFLFTFEARMNSSIALRPQEMSPLEKSHFEIINSWQMVVFYLLLNSQSILIKFFSKILGIDSGSIRGRIRFINFNDVSISVYIQI